MFLLTTSPYLKLKFFLFPSLPFQDENNKYLKLLDYIQHLILKIFLFQIKSPSAKGQRAGILRLPRQNDYRTFCMSDEAEKVCHKLEEVIGVC